VHHSSRFRNEEQNIAAGGIQFEQDEICGCVGSIFEETVRLIKSPYSTQLRGYRRLDASRSKLGDLIFGLFVFRVECTDLE
jgi:hypothetical protein